MLTDATQLLNSSPLFKGLPQDQLGKLAAIAVRRDLVKGEALFADGDPASGFFLVASGRIKVYKLSLEGKEQVLHLFGAGEVFGEVPVFAGGNYPAHAQAMEPGRVLFFGRNAVARLLRDEVGLALNMLAILSRRLRQFTRLIEDLSLKEVPGRLAAYLLLASERQNGADRVALDVSKGLLAGMLGTIPETLSRILNRMSQRNLIQVDGRQITLLDRDALIGLAEGEKL